MIKNTIYYFQKIIMYIPKSILRKINPTKFAQNIGVNMGDNCKIYGKVDFSTEPWIITIGKNVHITNNCKFITHDGGTLLFRDKYPKLEITKPINIGDNVYIGVSSIIMPGVNIGSNVIIGAGSIVTKDLESNFVYAGVPARKIKTISEYLDKIRKESIELGHLKGKLKDKALKEYYKKGL